MLARAGVLLMTAVDTIMTGRVGAAKLAAYALGNVPYVVFLLFGVGLFTGAVPLIAQADGAGRTEDCGRYWRLCRRTGLVVGLVLVVDGLQVVLLGALRGASDVWQPTLRLLAGCWLVLVPAAWLMGVRLELGLPGLLGAIALGLFVVAILLWLRLRHVLARPIRAL